MIYKGVVKVIVLSETVLVQSKIFKAHKQANASDFDFVALMHSGTVIALAQEIRHAAMQACGANAHARVPVKSLVTSFQAALIQPLQCASPRYKI